MEDKIRLLLEDEINKAGFILDEVFYGMDGGVNTLRLVIDKKGYININDCLKVNDIVNPILFFISIFPPLFIRLLVIMISVKFIHW